MTLPATDLGWVDDLDIDDFDLDLPVDEDLEFRGGGAYYSAIFSDADIVSHCRHGRGDGDGDSNGDSDAVAACGRLLAALGDGAEEEEAAGSSPAADSDVSDGPLSSLAAGDDNAAEAMSAYVAELERFLLEDDDEQAEVDQDLLIVDDYYFSGDQLLTKAEVVPVADAAAARSDEEEDEENSDGGNGVLAALEDEQQSASRKRARNKIKATTAMGRELEVMNVMTRLAQMHLPAAPWPQALLHVECSPVGSSLDLVEFELRSWMGLES